MSHDTAHHNTDNLKPGSSLTSSVWFMIIVAVLFISAVNFVQVMSHDDGGGHGEEHGTEHTEMGSPAHHGSEGVDHVGPQHEGDDHHGAEEHGEEAHH